MEAPEALGGPFNLIMASNAVHTCTDVAGDAAAAMDLHHAPCMAASYNRQTLAVLVHDCGSQKKRNPCLSAMPCAQRRWATSATRWRQAASC